MFVKENPDRKKIKIKIKKIKKVTPKQTKQDLNRETEKFLRSVDYARVRRFGLRSMLKSEI